MTDNHPRVSRPGWFADLGMGMKFAVSGGSSGWIRAALTALGVGLAVAMLLGAASIPSIAESGQERIAARGLHHAKKPGDDTLLVGSEYTQYRSYNITGDAVRAEGPNAPAPPGIPRLPKPGEVYVSPALHDLLSSPEGKLLLPRLDAKVVGTIDDSGLSGPSDLYYIRGSGSLKLSDDSESFFAGEVLRANGFGNPVHHTPLEPALVLVIIVAVVVLLLPVVMFVSIAARFGGERRDRRLAALRLIGADKRTLRRIAAGESLLGALGGLVVGAALFLVARQLFGLVTFEGESVFPADIMPNPTLAVLVVVAVPLVAILATLMAMRRLVVEPLGVMRQARGSRRRLWWRILVLLAGVGLMAWTLQSGFAPNDENTVIVGTGILLVLLGGAVMLPWLMEAVVKRLRGGIPGWQLATRQLQISGGTAARVVNGVAVAVAGGIALQMLFTGVQARFTHEVPPDAGRWSDVVVYGSAGENVTDSMRQKLGDIDGTKVLGTYMYFETDIEAGTDGEPGEVVVAPCSDLERLAPVKDCADGDVFNVDGPGAASVKPGKKLKLLNPMTETSEKLPPWTVPKPRSTVGSVSRFGMYGQPVLLVTPKAMGDKYQKRAVPISAIDIDHGNDDAIEYIRNAAALASPSWEVERESDGYSVSEDQTFSMVRKALIGGVSATMLLIGLGFLVSTLEQLQERRRLLSSLSAFGTRKRTMTASVLWQTAIPVAIGLAMATVIGAGLGASLMRLTKLKVKMDWANIGTILGLGAAMVLGVTVLSMPALWRLMRPDGIRTE